MNKLPMSHDYSRVIVTAMKDEAPFMLEWLSYHMSIGFTHFVILTNDCSDCTDKIARHYEKQGIVTHLNNKAPHPKGIQKTGYSRAERLDAIKGADWLLALDVDEYFRIDIGNGHLDDLFLAIGDKTIAVSLMWEMYGHNKITSLEDRFVTEQFTRSSTRLQANPYQIRGLKTLYKSKYFDGIGTHRPLRMKPDTPLDMHWIDGDGVPLPHMRENPRWLAYNDAQNFGITLGRINHYAIRSVDSFFLKLNRGFVNRTNMGVRSDKSPIDYWRMFNWNIVENKTILRGNDRHHEFFNVLMNDTKIARLHKQGFDWHKDRIHTLRIEQPMIGETELEQLGDQNHINEIDLSIFTNPVPSWDFPVQKFQNAKHKSILDASYLEHLDRL